MSKNTPNAVAAAKPARSMTTKTLAYCALLAALGVVLARLFGLMPNVFSRYSIEAVPTFLAGALFGPLAGGLVGFTSDLVGCLFSGYGYNPFLALPPILYGVCGGLFQMYLAKKTSYLRILVAFLPAVILGSVLWQSCMLTYFYFKDGPFLTGLLLRLGTRSIQFAITAVVDALIVNLLFKTRLFSQIGIWPPKPRVKRGADQK